MRVFCVCVHVSVCMCCVYVVFCVYVCVVCDFTHDLSKRFKELFGSLDALKAEGERLREGLSSLHSPVVFSHNDTQARNLVYWSCEGERHLVPVVGVAEVIVLFVSGTEKKCEWSLRWVLDWC